MIVLGVDPAQRSGFAFYDTDRSLSAIQAGVMKAEGETLEQKGANLGRKLALLMRERRPDLLAVEAPIRTAPAARRKVKFMGEEQEVEGGVTGLNAVISSNNIVTALTTAAEIKNVPWIVIAPATWRVAFLGFGNRPGWQRPDWKKAVREACAREKIPVTNDDQADAVGIAIAAKNTDAFKMLAYERSKGKAA